ncbi:zinc dependent phospholipase C family protein [Breznakiella homolactica]|uniref:Phospholipase C/D domain-containing protein n=1 Tax=Breznakiella homolactica TaxID=2798577 RepID=A0A7T8BCC1_9SPIR|nr:zinc dependent phospholipase C family protein [Breznakiella homolactica]QQO10985.1 zinc dependent phospholipase C family protein [Breznakiella homolactica]
MPSQVLHILFGDDVITEIYRRIRPRFGIVADKALEKIQISYRTAFSLGCQGPDLFYHSQNRRPVALEYGTLLHRRGYGMFTAVLLKMALPDPPPDADDIRMQRRENAITALGVYALGFMTHAILDRLAHPYIIYKSGWVSPAKPETVRYAKAHAFFERIIDVLMLRYLRGQEIASWNQDELLVSACENPPPGLKALLAKALVTAFPERAGNDSKLARRIDNAFLDAAGFYRFTDPRKTSLRSSNIEEITSFWMEDPGLVAYVYPEYVPLDIDYLNLSRKPWCYPIEGGAADRRSFPDIYRDTLERAVAKLSVFISRYLETGVFPIKEAASGIGNSGLSIQDSEGKPCAPSMSDPLPLDEVLAGQQALRRAAAEQFELRQIAQGRLGGSVGV